MNKFIAIPFEELSKLLEKNYVFPENKEEVIENLAKENATLKAKIISLTSDAHLEQHATRIRQEMFMHLADILKHGRLHDDLHAFEAVEKHLRRSGFGTLDFDEKLQTDTE